MGEVFKKLGVLNENDTVSITNLVVIIFVSILAFKMLFAGVKIDTRLFDWEILSPDVANTLPLLFGLMNYGHRRLEQNKTVNNTTTKSEEVK